MFVKPDNWKDLTPKERLALRMDHMVAAKGISFVSPEAEAAYKERVTIIRDAVELKKTPARVPVFPQTATCALTRAGLLPYDAWYNQEKAVYAPLEFDLEYQPDVGSGIYPLSGTLLDILGCRMMKWPGRGVAKEYGHQFMEAEYMHADEYGHLIADPTDFLLRKFFPRIHGSLKALEKFPVLTQNVFATMPITFAPFGMPDVQEALMKLIEAGKESMRVIQIAVPAMMASKAAGFPSIINFGGLAPFDLLGDLLRGMRGVMMDMYRRPELVIEACEKLVPFLVQGTLSMADMFDAPFACLPLHKGDDSHMSPEQFKKFYWPTLKKMMLAYCEEGLMPLAFAEGSYNMRLDIISDFPRGQCVWQFDRTDMARAKEALGDVACIMGNLPTSIMATGTPDTVKAYCKNLIDVCGKNGGFILTNGGAIDYVKPENMKAMIDFTKEYGVYA